MENFDDIINEGCDVNRGFVESEENFRNGISDDMDEVMSQIVIEGDLQKQDSVVYFGEEMLDEMDRAMSQMVYDDDEHGYVDSQGNFGYELLDDIDEAMSGMDYDVVSAERMDHMNEEAEINGDEIDENEIDGPEPDISLDILEQYEKAMGESMPKKSIKRYVQMYDIFVEWQKKNRTRSFDEKVLVAYFSSIGDKYKPSTLWSKYSMLKKTLVWKHNVDISNYCQLLAWLKVKNDGYECKQSNVFEPEHITRFVVEAPNEKYLAMKAILGIGVIGVCRGDELTNLTVDDVKDTGEDIIIKRPTTKTKKKKVNVINGEFTNIIREYMKLRPPNVPTNRFFLQYRNGKCTSQVIGKNWIAKMPKEMATFLKLPNPNSYTGHSYRRTGTTIAANAGASVEQLKRMGDWKSSAVCEKYIQESVGHKRKLAKLISGSINLPSTVTASTSGKMNLPDTINGDAISTKQTPMSNSNIRRSFSASTSSDSSGAGTMVRASSSATSSSVSYSDSHIQQAINVGARIEQLMNACETPSSVGINVPDDKKTIILHFGGDCSKFTIVNMK